MTPEKKAEILRLLERAKDAVFDAEQAIREAEKQHVNCPMYRMRLGLSDIMDQVKKDHPICDLVTMSEYTIHAYLKQFKYL